MAPCAEHAAKQLEANGGARQDRSKLYIGIGRAELNRTEFFQVGAPPAGVYFEASQLLPRLHLAMDVHAQLSRIELCIRGEAKAGSCLQMLASAGSASRSSQCQHRIPTARLPAAMTALACIAG